MQQKRELVKFLTKLFGMNRFVSRRGPKFLKRGQRNVHILRKDCQFEVTLLFSFGEHLQADFQRFGDGLIALCG
ncbi:MAG: hypothetical protein MN733_40250, partial [Nitrososphaera sp.]|nr:hypothetical protein [Nitrososphaera sp.]